jgi:hypothetical protein
MFAMRIHSVGPILYITGADPGFFAGRGPPLGADPEIWLGCLTVVTEGVGTHARRRRAPLRGSMCSEMRFQASPDDTILPQNYIE